MGYCTYTVRASDGLAVAAWIGTGTDQGKSKTVTYSYSGCPNSRVGESSYQRCKDARCADVRKQFCQQFGTVHCNGGTNLCAGSTCGCIGKTCGNLPGSSPKVVNGVCQCICSKACPSGTTRVAGKCDCVEAKARCTNGALLTQNAFNYAMDATASQYLFYVTCNLHDRCDCDTYCNDENHRTDLYNNFINNIKRDATVRASIINLTCAIQMGAPANVRQSIIVTTAKRMMTLNGRAYKPGCSGRPCSSTPTPPDQSPPPAPDVDNVVETPRNDLILGLDPTLAMGAAVVGVMVLLVMQK